MIDYSELPEFKGIFLEDSYVLDISESPGSLSFSMDFVLTPEHPAYHAPDAGEQHCYMGGVLEFSEICQMEWLERSTKRYVDVSGSADLGNIDSLKLDGRTYRIEGDWGQVRVSTNAKPLLTFD